MPKQNQPVIVIGMHRSGTSMLTRMLRELGLFIGWDYSDEHEALFFLNRNEKILNACGGSWDNPTVIDNLLNHEALRKKVVNMLSRDLKSLFSMYFLGPKLYFNYKSIMNLRLPWGWKDPRNTFLMPIWLEIFPAAKVIHIYRNGLDVASSLAVREVKRIRHNTGQSRTASQLMLSQRDQIADRRYLLYMIRKIQSLYAKSSPIAKYSRLKINPCISLAKGFELWQAYTERAFQYDTTIPNEIFTLKYEDFILEPAKYLADLNLFCDLKTDRSKITMLAGRVNVQRRFAFQENQALMQLYESVKNTYWMKKLGYCLESPAPVSPKGMRKNNLSL